MSLWIKICGNTSVENALFAAEAGANAVGFVFAASSRHVTEKQVLQIVPRLPEVVEKIAVVVDATLEKIEATVRECHLTGVQLHFDAASELPGKLRERFGAGLRILRVLHYGADAAAQMSTLAEDVNIDAVLIDSRTAKAVG